ncbi:hypothetical protein [Aliarcobacter cryaerophilus]|uniref:hypothetical protein n=1 Tax=Aliarcobacter cryaerophilus TaxID=28198 RepID=UPI0021B45959|nr:hypothetical protein [Aliarcobacter cryaerophilus]MCT7513695.1 hypothetical protein [Aliarcobacter cryaerophilus]
MLDKIAKEKICPFISNGEQLIKCIADNCIAWKKTDKIISIEDAANSLLEPNELMLWNKYRNSTELFTREAKEEEIYEEFCKFLEKYKDKLQDGYCLKIGDIEK